MRKLFLAWLFALIFQVGVFAQQSEFEKGIELAKRGDFQTALFHFQKSEANSAQIHYNIGVCFYRLNQPDKAVIEFEKALQINPDYERAYYANGMALVDLKNFDEAEKDFLKAIRLDENNGETWYDLAFVFYEQRKYDETIIAFRNAIKFKSVAKPVSYNNLGVIYALQGDFKSAKKQIEIALKLKVPEAKNNLEILRQISLANDKNLIGKLILKEKNNGR